MTTWQMAQTTNVNIACRSNLSAIHSGHLLSYANGFSQARHRGKILHRLRRNVIKKREFQVAHSTVEQSPQGLRTEPWLGSAEQRQALYEVQERMKNCPYGVPDEATCRWFLRDRKFDIVEAEEKLQEMMKWRREFGVDRITEAMVAAEAATGKAQLWDHPDVWGQPVVLVRVDRHVIGEVPLEDSIRLCVSVLEKAQQQAEAAGTETALGIFSLKDFGPQNADIVFAKFLIEALFTYYPKRFSQILFVDAPFVFQAPWKIIKPMLRKYSALVRFVSAKEVRNEYFTKETCPPDFV
uniref:Motile sperm domain-containing protein 2-like n=1 Tax=Tetraselmis sp. GSL018 TaxID=582737 RepID=A0A061S9V7_9CHLO|mmetsp:Transcript_26189/g.62291  ORF Transcript_26189/g.62291 Transcript_26189/m.62291 type:complete len:296 (+) Transcript_26189:115-1002(+)